MIASDRPLEPLKSLKKLRTATPNEDFNSGFADWNSTSFLTPRDGTHICRKWFVTSMRRGHDVDFAFEPLDSSKAKGLRLLMRNPPEIARVWHRLPGDLGKMGRAIVELGVRGEATGAAPLEVTGGLFKGDETERTFVSRLFGPLVMQKRRRRIRVDVSWKPGDVTDDCFLSLKFSGMGVFEIEFLRLRPIKAQARPWNAMAVFANRLLGRGAHAQSSVANLSSLLAGSDARARPPGGQVLVRAPEIVKLAREPVRGGNTINWVIGPPDNIGWAYGNNAERLAEGLSDYRHLVSGNEPADIAVYFDALVAQLYPVKARKSVLRLGGPRPLKRLFNGDEEAMRHAFSKFDVLIALNIQLYLLALRLHHNVHLIPNAIDLDRWQPAKRKRTEHSAFTIGFAASVASPMESEVKGHSIVNEAAERAGVRVLLASKGKSRISHDRMIKDFYSKIDGLVHPVAPGREGTSNVIMEALALGVPVITTAHAGLHGELLVDERSALIRERCHEAFGEGIELLRRDDGIRDRLAKGGRAFAEHHHDLSEATRRYGDVFRNLLAPPPQGQPKHTACFVPFWEPAENFGSSRLRAKYPSEILSRSGRVSSRVGYDREAKIAVIVQMCTDKVLAQLRSNPDQFVIYDVCDRYYEDPRTFKQFNPPIDSQTRFAEIAERADLIVVPSRELKAEIATRLPSKPVRYVHEPIDYREGRSPGSASQKKVVLWFGNPERGNFDSAKPLLEYLRDERGYQPLIVSRTGYFQRHPEFLPYCRQWSLAAMEEGFATASVCIVAHDGIERTKSSNRFVAAMMRGVPTLVSGSPACSDLLRATGNEFAIIDSVECLGQAMDKLEVDDVRNRYLTTVGEHITKTAGDRAIADQYELLFTSHTFRRPLFTGARRKVAFVSHNLANGEGAPRSLFELVKGLDALGIEPHVFAPAMGPLGDRYREEGIAMEVFEPTARHSVKLLNTHYKSLAQEFERFLRSSDIEAVVCNTVKSAPFAEIARRIGILSLVIVRESYTVQERFSYFDGEARYAAVMGLTNAPQVIFVADSSRKVWHDQGFKGTVGVVPNGISVDRFLDASAMTQAEARCRLGLPVDAVVALCVGTINERKGQRELLRWFAELAPSLRNRMHLVFVGAVQNAGYRNFSRQFEVTPQDVRERVSVMEAMDEVGPFYRAADMLLVNSRSEAYPRCVVEALYFGLPVVSTRVTGVDEQIVEGESGLFYDFGDRSTWASHVSSLVESEARRLKMGRAAGSAFWGLTGYAEMLNAYKAAIAQLLDRHEAVAS
jgi:glycosyltransferase involved in cell wall biosynthesis